jgi:hypothetical protein
LVEGHEFSTKKVCQLCQQYPWCHFCRAGWERSETRNGTVACEGQDAAKCGEATDHAPFGGPTCVSCRIHAVANEPPEMARRTAHFRFGQQSHELVENKAPGFRRWPTTCQNEPPANPPKNHNEAIARRLPSRRRVPPTLPSARRTSLPETMSRQSWHKGTLPRALPAASARTLAPRVARKNVCLAQTSATRASQSCRSRQGLELW